MIAFHEPVAVANESRLQSLPLLSLHLTERCNSRCVSCDYWRNGREDVTLESITRLLPSLAQLGTKVILLTGGEPLLHRQWIEISQLLRAHGAQLWLLTSGLSLAKHAATAAQLFQSITVSLDGVNAPMYAAIRGVDAFDAVCKGIRAVVHAGADVGIRVTVQRTNYRALGGFVHVARELGVRQISFLAADVRSSHAFGRADHFETGMALRADDLNEFARTLQAMERDHAQDFASGFIAEKPQKLRRLLDYYTAVCGLGAFPPVRCNAPEFSAVINADGRLQPCFFIAGPAQQTAAFELAAALNSEAMMALRGEIRAQRRPECVACVCSLWRDLSDLSAASLQLARS